MMKVPVLQEQKAPQEPQVLQERKEPKKVQVSDHRLPCVAYTSLGYEQSRLGILRRLDHCVES
jgi:hypothetical protein